MTVPLRILSLEDDEIFEGLIAGTLRSGRIDCELVRVETRDEFVRQLETGTFDLVLADYVLPSFDGLSALDIVHTRFPEVPFILLSGTMGEELAIESLQRGATDYVLKQRLSRLTPAVHRALTEARERRDRQNLEAQLRQAQKMECLGQLAGGMAHDFGNILSIIYGEMELLSLEKDLSPAVSEAIREVIHCAERGASLTRQLLTLGRKDEIKLGKLDLNPIVSNFMRMIQPVLGSRIRVQCKLTGSLPPIQADAGMIEQVLLNLTINARDAMPSGGEICCSAEQVLLDESQRRAHPDVPGTAVCLHMKDTGVGIPADVLPKLFEPFFTTKDAGKGTGLGLATVYGIVKQHHGWIEVESTPGRGTEFRVFFPAIEQEMLKPANEGNRLRMPDGTETILVVEDEEQLRIVMGDVLEGCGYTVLKCASGVEALEAWGKSAGRVELLLTDTALPGNMTGWDLAQSLLSEKPGLKIIFTSSYAASNVSRNTQLQNGFNFLHKPFRLPYLAQTVRGTLDGRAAINGKEKEGM